ncbi:TPA: hypothetical protein RNH74_002387 [Yersinia enterocolitica]|uniref:hypothetical protein n=1 Tax=Yersinia enterocolitica TaxID=630 RepID=UPI001CA590CA|nr:hypothetical protein [Yersinia enterocolitica]EKN3488535.1 hypothetical protein [Yersinia enterocolitica]EKN4018738.1 hypothetical protein [Yersinia enterocolitica]MBW5861489.1 hypothetical protein [Yersinia enterocolitica]HDL7233050.1 hypothetical protein [Yersinia enterocolitica]HDL7463871.1 hypothetical protein [Yersinia enterocolitica]
MCKKSGWPNLVLAGAAAKDTAQQWNKDVISGAYFRLLQLHRLALWQITTVRALPVSESNRPFPCPSPDNKNYLASGIEPDSMPCSSMLLPVV